MILINTIAHAEIALIMDRGVKKMRVNLFKDGRIIGFLKPVESFSKWGYGAGNREDSNLL